MSNIRWCCNGVTKEVFSYRVADELTDFPRGTFLAYGDALVTGFHSKPEAEQWLKEWRYRQTGNRTHTGIWDAEGFSCSKRGSSDEDD